MLKHQDILLHVFHYVQGTFQSFVVQLFIVLQAPQMTKLMKNSVHQSLNNAMLLRYNETDIATLINTSIKYVQLLLQKNQYYTKISSIWHVVF